MVDLLSLSPEHKNSLVMFREVIANERDERSAAELLSACNWNVEQALQLHWAAGDAPTTQATASASPALSRPLLDPNQPGFGVGADGLGILGKAANFVFRGLAILIQFLCSFFFGGPGFLPDDEATGALLSRDLASRYGHEVQLPRFFQGSFVQAVKEARKEVKLLVVYLHSGNGLYTDGFCRQVIANDFVRETLDENFLLWGGDVARSEAHNIAQMVHARQYPCFCVLLPASVEELRVIGSLHGDVKIEETVALISKCLEEMEVHRAEIVARQEQHKEDRSLREDQDREFQEAMEMDRILEEQKRDELAKQNEANRLAAEAQRAQDEVLAKQESERRRVEELRRAQAAGLPPPGPDATASVCIRLPTGQRIARKFVPAATLADVYTFANCLAYLPEHHGKGLVVPPRFMLRTSFPSKDLTEMGSNIQELQIAGAVILLVTIEDDE